MSSLDAGLRERLAGDLREILRAAGTTTVLVTHDRDEAYTLADHLAVMREGRVVQHGPTSQVWGAPADAATALFLGYARVLEPERAARLIGAVVGPDRPRHTGAVALRRSAVVVRPDGPLTGRVLGWRLTPDQVRLEVEVDGLGVLDAVADHDRDLRLDTTVRLGVDVERLALL